MPSKKKRNNTGSLKGFVILLLFIAGGIFLYQNQGKLPEFSVKEKVEEQIDQTIKKAESVKAQASNAVSSPKASEQPKQTAVARQLEIPVYTSKHGERILRRTGYTASYNSFYKTPNWVAWELTRKETDGKEKRNNKFLPDPDLSEPRVEHSDYTRSGYDRGHMAPAADMKWSEKAMQESFYMSNICPQNRKLNRDDWGDLEEACRKWAKKFGTVYIACGPIYDKNKPERIGKNKVAVPDRFFKVVLVYNKKQPIAMGFIFPNAAHHQKLQKYMTSVDDVERATGMDFFAKLPDSIENRIESIVPEMPSTR